MTTLDAFASRRERKPEASSTGDDTVGVDCEASSTAASPASSIAVVAEVTRSAILARSILQRQQERRGAVDRAADRRYWRD